MVWNTREERMDSREQSLSGDPGAGGGGGTHVHARPHSATFMGHDV